MKHKHADMIDAKKNNMDLVVFIKRQEGWKKQDCNPGQINFSERHEYFLCLPKHAETVMYSLNGGDVQARQIDTDWYTVFTEGWNDSAWYMRKDFESRIKPRKETRWAAYTDAGRMGVMTYSTKEQLDGHYGGCGKGYQAVSFEVEV